MGDKFDLRQKKVIDLETAEFLGYIRGMDIDFESGKINSVTIPDKSFFGFFRRKKTITLSWEKVVSIGSEYVIIRRNDKKLSENLQKQNK